MDTVSLPHHTHLLTELFTWQDENPSKITYRGSQVLDNERLLLNLSINDYEFQLFCPSGYPQYEDNFYVTASAIEFWCHALNDFLLDSSKKPLLRTVLSKALTLQSSSDDSDNSSLSESESESENEYDDEQNYTSIDTKTTNWDSIIWKKKSQWRTKESELRLKLNQPKTSDMFDGLVMDHPKQVFSSSAASGILINDLTNIMKTGNEIGIEANAIDNNIFKWSVFLTKFNPSSQIARDLVKIKERYGYNYIELQLDFKLDRYPFCPPLVQLVRPMMENTIIKNLYHSNLLKLDQWKPICNMKCVLQQIKTYFEMCGIVNINNERNDALKYPEGIYTNIEKHCLQLSGIIEMSCADVPFVTETVRCQSSEIKSPFPKGVGYATEGANIWHKKYILIEEQEKNLQIGTVLKKILDDLTQREVYSIVTSEIDILHTSNDSYSSFTFPLANRDANENVEDEIEDSFHNVSFKRQSLKQTKYDIDLRQNIKTECNVIVNPIYLPESQDFDGLNDQLRIVHEVATDRSESAKHVSHSMLSKDELNRLKNNDNVSIFVDDNHEESSENTFLSASSPDQESSNSKYYIDMIPIIKESPLIPFIKSKLSINTFVEMSQHKKMYTYIIDILKEFALNKNLVFLLGEFSMEDESIEAIMKRQEANARDVLKKLYQVTGNTHSIQHKLHKSTEDEQIARNIIDVSELIQKKLRQVRNYYGAEECLLTDSQNSSCSNSRHTSNDFYHDDEQPLKTIYKNALKPLQFCSIDIDINTHSFQAAYKTAYKNMTRKFFVRVAQEFTTLSTSLPLELSSGIFVRTDDSKCTVLRALIIGSEDTPYSGGCFGFDIYLSQNYPKKPPRILCTTPGNGRNQINPNIFCCGKICLSLLNTWFGHGGEIWTVDSTILQRLSKRPEVIENIISSSPGLNEDSVAIAILQDPDLMVHFTDPDTVRRIAELHPVLVEAAQHIAAAVHEEAHNNAVTCVDASTSTTQHTAYSYSLDNLSDDEEMAGDSSQSSDSNQPSNIGANQSNSAITTAQLATALSRARTRGFPLSLSLGSTPGNSTNNAVITTEMFTQAMQQAFASAPGQAIPPALPPVLPQLGDLQRQLAQMHEMGLQDDAVNVQALQFTNGDVQAAIELVFSGFSDN